MPDDADVAKGGKWVVRDKRVVLLGLGALGVIALLAVVLTRSSVAPAVEGETLILFADFADQTDTAGRGLDPAQVIYEQLLAQAQEDGLNVRIERLREVVHVQNVAEVRDRYGATLIVWGEHDAVSFTPRVDPVPFTFGASTDLPAQARSLALSILGAYHFALEDYPRALHALDRTLSTIASDVQVTLANEDAYVQGTSMRYLSGSDRTVADVYQSAPRYHSAFAYFNRGLAYQALGNAEKAVADFEQALELSNEVELQSRVGEQLAQLGVGK